MVALFVMLLKNAKMQRNSFVDRNVDKFASAWYT